MHVIVQDTCRTCASSVFFLVILIDYSEPSSLSYYPMDLVECTRKESDYSRVHGQWLDSSPTSVSNKFIWKLNSAWELFFNAYLLEMLP